MSLQLSKLTHEIFVSKTIDVFPVTVKTQMNVVRGSMYEKDMVKLPKNICSIFK